MIQIVVDVREDAVIAKLAAILAEREASPKSEKLQMTTKALDIGDVSFVNTDTGKEILLFERKSLPDLLASIKDGRYEEQSHRLVHASGLPMHNIVYVIEGLLSQLRSDADRRVVFSAITSLSFFKGFSVLRTSTVQETADLLAAMADKIQREHKKGNLGPPPIIPGSPEDSADIIAANGDPRAGDPRAGDPYSSFVKKTKKDNITGDNIGEIMLCQIPGVSSAAAQELLKTRTFAEWIAACKSDGDVALKDVALTGANGKTRKLGSNVKAALVRFLGAL